MSRADWLRGFADGEGYVTKSRTATGKPSGRAITLTNTDEALIQYACESLDSLGITYRVVTRLMVNRKPIQVVLITHQENLKKWRDLIGFTAPKKRQSLNQLISEYEKGRYLWSDRKKDEIGELLSDGWSHTQLSKLLDIPQATLSRTIRKFSLEVFV